MDRSELNEQLFVHTSATQRAWKRYFYDIMGAENLQPGEMSILFYLKSHEPASSKQIGTDLLISKSSAAQAIDSLQQMGLVSREVDKFDRRITYTSLSKAGHKKVASLEAKRKDFFIKMTAGLTDQEIQNMITGQKKMAEQINKQRTEPKGDIA